MNEKENKINKTGLKHLHVNKEIPAEIHHGEKMLSILRNQHAEVPV